ncbi:MAG: protein kinase [bacterium]
MKREPENKEPEPENRADTTVETNTSSCVQPAGDTAVGEAPRAPPGNPVMHVEGGLKYEMKRVVGAGGMGVIYEAVDLKCERSVAIKVLLEERKSQNGAHARFTQEAKITAQLEHPNIIPIHELGSEVGGNMFYSMKLVQGVTLADVLVDIRKNRQATIEKYPLGRLLTIFQKVCDAVAFSHGKGVFHRDLKPSNVMIGEYGEVLVLDWGLAVSASYPGISATGTHKKSTGTSPDGIDEKTTSNEIVGTPSFMSPEQIRGASADARSDIYSLGAILYSILTLHSPITGKDLKEVLRRITEGDIEPPLDYNQKAAREKGRAILPHCPGAQIPPFLSDVAMKALAVDPASRYQSVKEFQSEIESFQNGTVWHLIVDEDFSDAEFFSRWEAVGGQCEIQDGELKMSGGEPQMLLLKQPLTGDVRLEFECYQTGNFLNDIACILSGIRRQSAWDTSVSGYAFKYGAFNNSLILLARRDINVFLKAAVAPIVQGTKYRVVAERMGSRLRLVVNDQEVIKFVDPASLVGSDRTLVGLLGWVANTHYSSIRVYSLGTPWKVDLLDIAERHVARDNIDTAVDLFQDVMDSFPDADRMEQARKGRERALQRREILRNLPAWKERLQKTWPSTTVDMRMDIDGLVLEIGNGGIKDLSPIGGMPISTLLFAGNDVESLEPLRGMPLVALKCGGNPIQSLEPLRGSNLETFHCDSCRITSLAPLQGMSLLSLSCAHNPLQDGLEALRGMPLAVLSCGGCGIGSLESLRGLPISILYCDSNQINDLDPLRGMPLTSLTCAGNQISSLEPLRGMQLNSLHCGCNQIDSLEPLKGMPLNMISCHCNRIRNLQPLVGMALNSLTCGGNLLTSIGPFIKTPPSGFQFDCDMISTEELEWMRQAWSRDLRFVYHSNDVEKLIAIRKGDVALLKSRAAEFKGHRYLFIPKCLTWEQAKAACENLGGHLLTLTSAEEHDFIASWFPHGSWFWLGLKTTQNGPEWVTGEPVEFRAFLNVVHERVLGPKVFCYKHWYSDMFPGACNSFMVEWDD